LPFIRVAANRAIVVGDRHPAATPRRYANAVSAGLSSRPHLARLARALLPSPLDYLLEQLACDGLWRASHGRAPIFPAGRWSAVSCASSSGAPGRPCDASNLAVMPPGPYPALGDRTRVSCDRPRRRLRQRRRSSPAQVSSPTECLTGCCGGRNCPLADSIASPPTSPRRPAVALPAVRSRCRSPLHSCCFIRNGDAISVRPEPFSLTGLPQAAEYDRESSLRITSFGQVATRPSLTRHLSDACRAQGSEGQEDLFN